MILQFPDFDTLRLVLASGIVPPAVSLEPAIAGEDDAGRPWIDTPAKLPRTIANQLAKLGVASLKTYPSLGEDLNNWLQALPLEREERQPELGTNAPVLFELAGAEQLPEVVGEMLRLSVDRQGFRWIKDDDSGAGPVLLRVIGPPYYTLLRALDREHVHPGSVRAYVEQAPRVWVEIGWTHPLVRTLAPKEGQMLLLRPPRDWVFLTDTPFRDIYEILDFKLPQSRLDWEAAELRKRLIVPLRLIESDRHDAELWVLRENAVDQLDALVRDAKDSLLQRLIFAVGRHEGEITIVLRVRPSKQTPPQLVLKAEAYSKYLKLDNLFLPQGTKIHPILRRDAIRKLLAEDPAQINWLRPHSEKPGVFIPESLPDDAFRPLNEWVDYVLDHDRDALTSWVQEFRFDFESFQCTEDGAEPKPKDPPERGRRKGGSDEEEPSPRTPRPGPAPKKRESSFRIEKDEFAEIEILPPTQLQEELAALEKQFLEMAAALDDPTRLPLWQEMATRNAALKQSSDAAICWMNLLWELLDLPSEVNDVRRDDDVKRRAAREARLDALRDLLARAGGEEELAWQWLRGESFFRDRGDKKFAALIATRRLTTAHLDELLKIDATAPHEVRALLACVIWGSLSESARPALMQRMAPILHFIQKNEKMAPIRAIWLAWYALSKLSGDLLGLARVRDRLIERLVSDGLSPERDLPNLLRNAGHHDSERMRAVRGHVGRLYELAVRWCDECETTREGQRVITVRDTTGHYVDLMFAFAMARLGEATGARELLKRAEQRGAELVARLNKESSGEKAANRENFAPVHEFLVNAFKYRIEQAIASRPHLGPLPAAMRDSLEHAMSLSDPRSRTRYLIDRMRQQSKILEPQERFEVYRDYLQKQVSEVNKVLATLPTIKDSSQLGRSIQSLLKGSGKPISPEEMLGVLSESLMLSPRVGEWLALELLQRVEPALDKVSVKSTNPDVLSKQAQLIERALFVAANYERAEIVQRLWPRFVHLLQSGQQSRQVAREVNRTFAQCLRSLRKLGLREEIGSLLERAELLVKKNNSLAAILSQGRNDSVTTISTLLYLAGGWMLLGQTEKAAEVINAAREMLYREEKPGGPNEIMALDYVDLAATFASVLGMAPVEIAIPRIEEMFKRMRRLRDTHTSSSAYARLHLTIIEAVVLAIVHEDFGMGPGARRWMEDDEYLVRRRIHRDHRHMMAKGNG